MKNILNNKFFRIILSIFVIGSIIFVPSFFAIILTELGIKNEMLVNLVSLILYLIILLLIYYPELKTEFMIFKGNYKNCFSIGIKYWVLGLFIMMVSNIVINYLIMGGSIAANEELNRQALLENPLFYTLLNTAILAPLLEEIVFRKSIDNIFKDNRYYYVLSGLLFGFAHTLADLSNLLNLLYIIPYGALGFTFAIMDKETKTTFTSIMMHALHNFVTIILLYFTLR